MIDEQRNEDRVLRRAVLRGDEAAWRLLFDRYFDMTFAYALYSCANDRALAEDLTQEAWSVAVRRIRTFDPDRARFGTWVRGIIDHLHRGHIRREMRRDRLRNEHTSVRVAENVPAHSFAEGEHIALAFAEIPSRYAAVIRAKYERNLSVNEIAEAWGETPKAVESLLTRARRAFRDAYNGIAEQ